MKNILVVSTMLLLALVACKSKNNHKAETSNAQTESQTTGVQYQVDTTQSVIDWKGTKPNGYHTGTFKLDSGVILVNNLQLVGGSFVINMNSLTDSDITNDADSKNKLENHLKSADFFDVAKYPTGKFVITGVKPYNSTTDSTLNTLISGNLTIKDSTQNIEFPASVVITDKIADADAKFDIDRTRWGLNYKGPNNPQNWVISKTVTVSFNVKSTYKQ